MIFVMLYHSYVSVIPINALFCCVIYLNKVNDVKTHD